MNKNIVSFSGGKDSSAMLLRMVELGYKIDKIIFADTTLEFPEMYTWINTIEELIDIKIKRVTAKHTWDDWFYGKYTRGKKKGLMRGFPYVISVGCWWSRDCKLKPIEKEQGEGNNIFIGIAKNEEKRSKAKQYNNNKHEYIFPLIEWGWTEKDCVDYLVSNGLKHPLTNFKRTGCWLCPKQSFKSLELLYLNYPELWNKLKKYERDSPQGFKPNFSLEEFEINIKSKSD